MITPRSVLLRMRNFQTKFVEKKKYMLFSIIYFFPKIVPFMKYEIYGRARQATNDNIMRSACWITRATNTHLEYVILI